MKVVTVSTVPCFNSGEAAVSVRLMATVLNVLPTTVKVATVLTVPALITAKVATGPQRPSYNREGGDRPYRPRFNNGEGGGYRSNNGGGGYRPRI